MAYGHREPGDRIGGHPSMEVPPGTEEDTMQIRLQMRNGAVIRQADGPTTYRVLGAQSAHEARSRSMGVEPALTGPTDMHLPVPLPAQELPALPSAPDVGGIGRWDAGSEHAAAAARLDQHWEAIDSETAARPSRLALAAKISIPVGILMIGAGIAEHLLNR